VPQLQIITTSTEIFSITEQQGTADTVVRAMNFKYRKHFLGSHSFLKFSTNDCVDHPTSHANFGYVQSGEEDGVAAHARNLPLGI